MKLLSDIFKFYIEICSLAIITKGISQSEMRIEESCH